MATPNGPEPNPLDRLSDGWLRRARRTIACFEVFGGVVAMSLVILVSRKGVDVPWYIMLQVESFGLLGLFAGVLLWKGANRGYELSRIFQWAQVIRLSLPGLTYTVAAGPEVLMIVNRNGIGGYMGFSGTVGILLQGNTTATLAINIFPIAALVLLVVSRRRSANRAHRVRSTNNCYTNYDSDPD